MPENKIWMRRIDDYRAHLYFGKEPPSLDGTTCASFDHDEAMKFLPGGKWVSFSADICQKCENQGWFVEDVHGFDRVVRACVSCKQFESDKEAFAFVISKAREVG